MVRKKIGVLNEEVLLP